MKCDDVIVKVVDQLIGVLMLVENEELVSNIVFIIFSDLERKFQVSNCDKFYMGSCIIFIFFYENIINFIYFVVKKSDFVYFEIILRYLFLKRNVIKSLKIQYEIYDVVQDR